MKSQRRLFKSQRRKGEVLMMIAGVGVALLGLFLDIKFVSYGGLCILGLGVISVFWR
jgi:hypothetical protein